MSEYQYYEFQALDRRLDEAARRALRELSTRAKITATSFTNHYEWGDFKGDPAKLMNRWFDLHLYLANWGTRRLMIRVPDRSIDLNALAAIAGDSDDVTIRRSGTNVIFDICREELEPAENEWGYEDDSDAQWLAAMEPLRADLIEGDLRLFYLLWLANLESGEADADATEPLPGIGPLTDALSVFATFFRIDGDLVAAAAERSSQTVEEPASPEAIRQAVAALPEPERLDILVRLAAGDPQVAADFRRDVRRRLSSGTPVRPKPTPRTAGELLARAGSIRAARARAAAEQEAERQRKKLQEEAKARRAKLDAILRRGDAAWREVEAEIERKSSAGYDKALDLLTALKTLADERGTERGFEDRLASLRERHGRKGRFIERLDTLE